MEQLTTFQQSQHNSYSLYILIKLINIKMKEFKVTLLIFFLLVISTVQSPLNCLQFLNELQQEYNTSRAQFAKTMAPYLLLSGKILDDMGFPISCKKFPVNNYWEVEISLTELQEKTQLTMYYGLCFTGQCNAEQLNQYSDFFIETIFKNMTDSNYQINSVQFNPVEMEIQYTAASIIVCVVLSLFILSRMVSSFVKWGRLCMADSEEEALAIDSEEMQEDKQAGRMPQHSLTFLEKYSLARAFGKLFQKQQGNKIIAFSYFKLFSLPFIVFGYLFYLSNNGAYNYFSFNNQVYRTFYSKVATYAYYLPDIFFFISGYVFTKKLIEVDETEDNKSISVLAAFAKKLIKLYPLYFVVILVYWAVTPTLHAGPLWNVYQDTVGQCSYSWWRSLLMIDNWFVDGCFNYSWYVQVQVQFALLLSVIFIIYGFKRVAALGIVYSLLFTSFIFIFTFGGKLPSSIETTISDDAVLYFQAFYSHLFFYMFGVTLSILFQKESVKSFVRNYYSQNIPVFTALIVVGFALVIFIILRPGVWQNALGLELAFCRTGMMLAYLFFFLSSMADDQIRSTSVHRLSKLTYSIILWIGLIVSSGFWGLNTFPYVDGLNLLSSSLTYLLISLAVGGSLGVVFDITPFTIAS